LGFGAFLVPTVEGRPTPSSGSSESAEVPRQPGRLTDHHGGIFKSQESKSSFNAAYGEEPPQRSQYTFHPRQKSTRGFGSPVAALGLVNGFVSPLPRTGYVGTIQHDLGLYVHLHFGSDQVSFFGSLLVQGDADAFDNTVRDYDLATEIDTDSIRDTA